MENASKPGLTQNDGTQSFADGAVTGLHSTVDRAAATAGAAAMSALPVIDGAAQGAHRAVDRVADVMSTPSQWVAQHPLQSLSIAFTAGLVIGRLSR